MSGRNSEPKKPSSGRPGFLARTKAMSAGGSSGWEATTIGFTLVGCIGACSALGYWLDNHFKTGYWLPILFLVGVVAGFREMFVVLGRISKEEAQKRLEKQQNVKLAPNPLAPDATVNAADETPQRDRIFQVPPPPTPGQKLPDAMPIEAFDADESVEDLIERLSQQNEPDEPK